MLDRKLHLSIHCKSLIRVSGDDDVIQIYEIETAIWSGALEAVDIRLSSNFGRSRDLALG